jgi:hypothetical protein
MTMVSQFKLSDQGSTKPAAVKVKQTVKKPLTGTGEKPSINLDSKGHSKYGDF